MVGDQSAEAGSARFRIVAAEAHSWASLLIEDERGNHYLYLASATAATAITPDAAADLLSTKAYRPWRGDRSWAPLDALPVAAFAGWQSSAVPTALLADGSSEALRSV